MALLRGLKRCSQFDSMKNEAKREEIQVMKFNEKLKDYKQWWKEHLEQMSDSRLAKQVQKYKPICHRCLEDIMTQEKMGGGYLKAEKAELLAYDIM